MPSSETTQRVQSIPLKTLNFATGTWTYTQSTGATYYLKTATAETSVVTIPIDIPRRADQFGVKLLSIKLPIRVITADLTAAPTIALYRQDYDLVNSTANGDAVFTAITTTNNGVVTADSNDRLLTVAVTAPDWDYSTQTLAHYVLNVSFAAAATSVIRVYCPFVTYEALG
jgi:hypothetical protein